jgi:hypothetical protein
MRNAVRRRYRAAMTMDALRGRRSAAGPAATATNPARMSAAGGAAPLIAIGATAGLAWTTSLRGFMAQVAGAESAVTWSGTFLWILLPGVLCGGLLGWAEHLRRTGGRRRWRWLVLSPFLFTSVLLPGLLDPKSFLQDGIGGGAIGLPVIGILGGYALCGRGRLWTRVAAAIVVLAGFTVWALTATAVGGPSFALNTPKGAWLTLEYYSLLAVLCLACSIPLRPLPAQDAKTFTQETPPGRK